MEIYNYTAHELRDMFREKKVSVPEVAKAYIDRIKQVESKVEAYNLVLDEEEIIKNAQGVQKGFDAGDEMPALAGIPMAIKDNMCTRDVVTTCSSKMLNNFVPPYDAAVVKKLKNEKTVLLGKVNMDEFAMGGSTENSAFKKTKNPWDLDRVPGGSSGGSVASVSADEAVFALGSDTGGSIRQPASFCGVVGLKPTYGAVSRYGLIAFASSLDQIGPVTKDIADCALVLNTITGYDPDDSTSVNMSHPDYTKALINDVKGLKIGLPKEYFGEGINEEVKKSVLNAADVLKKLGAEVGEVSLPMAEYALPAYYLISSAEASSNLARFDGVKYGYRAEKFNNLIDLYKKSRSEGFGPEVKRRIMLGTYALSAGYYDAYYKKALQVKTMIKRSFDQIFEGYDLIMFPTSPTTAFKFGEKSDNPLEMYLADICTVSINIAGLPGINVPCGFDSKGLPIGFQLVGKAFNESTMLRAGYTYEQNTNKEKRRPSL
ncbi:MAG: Asp-tRNA(Asn)/Glu-tRNA(Gln) amidotransferase subunit GatA [Deltaproteobacteria bacterium]